MRGNDAPWARRLKVEWFDSDMAPVGEPMVVVLIDAPGTGTTIPLPGAGTGAEWVRVKAVDLPEQEKPQ